MDPRIQLLKNLSKPCAKICEENFQKSLSWSKDDTSPVTEADIKVNDLIIQYISEEFPEDAILSEESEDDGKRFTAEYTWIIDPIDGTSEFISGSPEFCIMICIIHKNQPYFAGITIPAEHKAYFGGPNFPLNEFHLGSEKETEINLQNTEGLPLIISKSRSKENILRFAEVAKLDTLRCGSAGVKACRVIQGKAAHYVHINKIAEWDTAAPDCLLRSFSQGLIDLENKPLEYNKTKPHFNAFIFSLDQEVIQKALSFFNS